MDQEVAALLAAGFGVVGAGIGGAAAVWGAKIGAERTALATRQQAQDQTASEHAHWLRQQRLDAYEQFEDLYYEISLHTLNGEPADIEAAVGMKGAIVRSSARIQILGPPAVAASVERTTSALLARLVAAVAMNRMSSGVDGEPDLAYEQMITGLFEETQRLPEIWAGAHSDFVAATRRVMGSA